MEKNENQPSREYKVTKSIIGYLSNRAYEWIWTRINNFLIKKNLKFIPADLDEYDGSA